MDGTTACVVLGVPLGATRQTIKKAFRRLAPRAHPDVSGSADEFRLLKEAYDVAYALAPKEVAGPTELVTPFPAPEPEPVTQLRTVGPGKVRPSAARARHRRSGSKRAPWLTTVLTDFPATASYEALVGQAFGRPSVGKPRVATVPSPAQQREANFAEHLAKAMASAA